MPSEAFDPNAPYCPLRVLGDCTVCISGHPAQLYTIPPTERYCKAWRKFPPACGIGHCPDEDGEKCPCEKFQSRGGYCLLVERDCSC